MTPFPPTAIPFQANLWLAARLLPSFSRAEIGTLLRMATPPKEARAYTGLGAREITDAVQHTTARPWRMRGRRCLREGLLAFHYLSLAGHRPILHFAVEPASLKTDKTSAHCWVSVDGDILLNPPSPTMMPLFTYDGTRQIPSDNSAPGVADLG
ncbi:lasso peptide biosynthesis B2 protein [Tepidamorphus sp. 3E244]|uniref:lasso peptide biosynthesis B2 protein n=1 Tax=Tepidamorphus sp. 3E244 TaxID=3385498 RepID=UPI0038FCDD90